MVPGNVWHTHACETDIRDGGFFCICSLSLAKLSRCICIPTYMSLTLRFISPKNKNCFDDPFLSRWGVEALFLETVLPTDGPHVFQVTGALAVLGYCNSQQLVSFSSAGSVTDAATLLQVSVSK